MSWMNNLIVRTILGVYVKVEIINFQGKRGSIMELTYMTFAIINSFSLIFLKISHICY